MPLSLPHLGQTPPRTLLRLLGAISILGAVGPVPTLAEPQAQIHFDHSGFRDGLSQAFVTSAVQDPDGFMWFGTQEGLNRFDGYEFVTFTSNTANPRSIADDFVRELTIDSSGSLWIGTDAGGLSRFDGDGFVTYRHDPENSSSLASDRVRVVFEGADGRFWVGTDDGGLQLLDRQTGTFTTITLLPGDEAPAIRAIEEDRQGNLWIGTDGAGLFRLDAGGAVEHWHPQSATHLFDAARVRSLHSTAGGQLWVGTYEHGLLRRGDAETRWARFQNQEGDPNSLGRGTVWTLLEDADGNIWAGTDGGLSQWRRDGSGFWNYTNDPANPHSLSNNRVLSLFQDRAGVIWVGTYAGLSRWSPSSAAFRHYRAEADPEHGLLESFVTSFAEHPDGAIWIGTYGGGLSRFDRGTETFRHYQAKADDVNSLPDDRVTALAVDRNGHVFLGTLSAGLSQLDPTTGRFRHWRHSPERTNGLSANAVTSLLEDRAGRLWIGTYGGGLNRLDADQQSFTVYRAGEERGALSSDRVLTVFEDRSGTLWIGTHGGGIARYRAETDDFDVFQSVPEDPSSLSSNNAWAIVEDERGDLWISTQDGGVNRWLAEYREGDDASFFRYTEATGLPSRTVYGALYDDQGSLWFSTNAGLARLAPETGRFTYFDHSHGLQSNEFNGGAFLRATNGELFFGGINGFNAFRTNEVGTNTTPPTVAFTEITKRGSAQELQVVNPQGGKIRLDHTENVLTVEFAALDYTAPERNRFAYRLIGFNSNWVETDERRLTYTNLAPGNYTLEVRGTNNDQLWSTDPTSIEIEVGAAPWRTPLAYTGYGLIAAVALLLYLQAQRRKRARAEELAKVNAELRLEVEQRTLKEHELQIERRKAQKVLDTAEVVMLILGPDGRVDSINPKGCRVVQADENEIVGRDWRHLFVPDEQRQKFDELLQPPYAERSFEAELCTRSGKVRDIVWHAAPLPDEEDGQERILLSGTDITHARWLATARARAESESRAKSRFLANLSHEIRTPISAVLGMLEMLTESGLDTRQSHFAQTARRSARALLDLLNDILDLSKIEAGKLELEEIDFDLGEVVGDVWALFREPAAEKGLEFSLQVEDDVAFGLRGDPTRLRQLLSNLASNAVKFTKDGGVDLRVSRVTREAGLDTLRFEVSDTGVGMEPVAAARVFDSFHQADGSTAREYGGTGLGLAITRQLVELMGGTIGVGSERNVGSTFWFELPFALSEEDPHAARIEGAGLLDARILVLEARPDETDSLVTACRPWGLETESVTSESELLERLADLDVSEQPILALVEVDALTEPARQSAIRMRGATENPNLRLVQVTSAAALTADGDEVFDSTFLREATRTQLLDSLIEAGTKTKTSSLSPFPRSLTGFRFLVAEDHEAIREVVVSTIRRLGGLVDAVDSGGPAVEAFAGRTYDLILMDVQMPGIDGITATKQIRRREQMNGRNPRVPIIAMTANAVSGDRDDCLAAGMDGYLSKPFTTASLRRCLLGWLTPDLDLDVDRDEPLPAESRSPDPEPGPTKETVEEIEFPRSKSIDQSMLRRWTDTQEGGSLQLLGGFVSSFRRSTPRTVTNMRRAFDHDNEAELLRLAHSLRGSSGMIGATRLARLCRLVEEKTNSKTLRASDLQALERESAKVCRLFDGLLAELERFGIESVAS